jgi:hypothetical protein
LQLVRLLFNKLQGALIMGASSIILSRFVPLP